MVSDIRWLVNVAYVVMDLLKHFLRKRYHPESADTVKNNQL